MNTKLTFGSGRFSSVVTNNYNGVLVGDFDLPTKLVDTSKDVLLCLPREIEKWGMYPTHQESWLCLTFVVGCHSQHESGDTSGLEIRRSAWAAIPSAQWQALTAKAIGFIDEFRQRLVENTGSPRKLYKSLTRALQDCVLYLSGEFPEDQDAFLTSSPVAMLIELANRGRSGELTLAEGTALADEAEAIVSAKIIEFGGLVECSKALHDLELGLAEKHGRVILLPEKVSLDEGSKLVSYDIVLGTPDAHDMDVVSVAAGATEPRLVQLTDKLSGQRMDIIQVAPELGPKDELVGGHKPFQSVAEMILANGLAISPEGKALIARLQGQVSPAELAQKYRKVAKEIFSDASNRKSWASRRAAGTSVPQVKKVLPLYRIACDLLPRAAYMEREERFTGGMSPEGLANEAGLGDSFRAIRNVLDRQDATNEELEAIAARIERKL
ncbi:MAG: hypothetical protein A3H57_04685 [Candidatus Taylorbacteria bacterium RIFCSPLOWO2_02_FULL_43_11]|nr:MAG: hypothetical protein A3B08_00945 [Candidatus Taylorbacteria bacterium RIFCSPLOWO2_01_FULL_43_44]OHA35620.1 MAG: hypothetical protein A3H57_04685 [Candidatus Taylorbacteria bacterium RIFCSPLOWO2_02_FULL_43_11]